MICLHPFRRDNDPHGALAKEMVKRAITELVKLERRLRSKEGSAPLRAEWRWEQNEIMEWLEGCYLIHDILDLPSSALVALGTMALEEQDATCTILD